MQYNAIPCTLITADGAYHCPVGSIMAIFDIQILMPSEKENEMYFIFRHGDVSRWLMMSVASYRDREEEAIERVARPNS